MKLWKPWTAGVAFFTLSLGCQSAPAENPTDAVRAVFSGNGAEWIDMTYVLDENTVFWPTARPFELEVVSAGVTDAGYYYGANNFCTAEHGGTHLDAPIHFSAGKQTADQIPVDRLVGPAIVLDASQAAAADPDYLIKVRDLEAWEEDHGAIPDGSILLLRTGWGAHWPDRGRYLGTTKTGEEAIPELHFPGLDPAAASWLVENRNIDAIGIDTASIDYGQSTLFETHRILLAENIPAFENVASLDRLPETGSYVIGLPMKIRQGTGSPLRLLGVLPGLGDAPR
jgi:kynurenine formamidase